MKHFASVEITMSIKKFGFKLLNLLRLVFQCDQGMMVVNIDGIVDIV